MGHHETCGQMRYGSGKLPLNSGADLYQEFFITFFNIATKGVYIFSQISQGVINGSYKKNIKIS